MAKAKKTEAPKNKLAPLQVKSVQKTLVSGDIPTLMVEGNYPTQYNEAVARLKAAEGEITELRPLLIPDARAELFRHNVSRPWDTISSVRLQDDSGSVLLFSFVNKYSDVNQEAVEALFADIRDKHGKVPDINTYFGKTLVGKFDSTVFLDEKGQFDPKRFAVLQQALETASAALGVPNPLTTQEVVKPKGDFHSRRWNDFDEGTNETISKVVQNTVTLSPRAKAVAD